MKASLLIILLSLFSGQLFARNYFDDNEQCLDSKDIKSISNHFKQFQKFDNSKELLCLNKNIDSKLFKIIKSILALKSLEVPNYAKTLDPLSSQAISNKDWWGYFKQRASKVKTPSLGCSSGIIAYVSSFKKQEINFCPDFFNQTTLEQVHVLMHEVRHFDGYSHVKCTQGLQMEAGGKSCDKKLSDGGSYAVSLQSFVTLSKSPQLDQSDRILAESLAIQSVNNRFNERVKTIKEEYLLLSDSAGDIYKANVKNFGIRRFIKRLPSPAKIYTSNLNINLFPIDKNYQAYRLSFDFSSNISSIGLLAEYYNKLDSYEKSQVTSINYMSPFGGFIKDGKLHSLCSEDGKKVTVANNITDPISNIYTYIDRNNIPVAALKFHNGRVALAKCNSKKRIELNYSDLKHVDHFENFVTFDDYSFLLDEKGEILQHNIKSDTYQSHFNTKTKWISIAPYTEYSFFKKN